MLDKPPINQWQEGVKIRLPQILVVFLLVSHEHRKVYSTLKGQGWDSNPGCGWPESTSHQLEDGVCIGLDPPELRSGFCQHTVSEAKDMLVENWVWAQFGDTKEPGFSGTQS